MQRICGFAVVGISRISADVGKPHPFVKWSPLRADEHVIASASDRMRKQNSRTCRFDEQI
jgi:hypothetical protein